MVDLVVGIEEAVDVSVMEIGIGAEIEAVVGIAAEDLEIDIGDGVAAGVVQMMVAPISKHLPRDVVVLMGAAKVMGLVVGVEFARCFLAVVYSLQEDD